MCIPDGHKLAQQIITKHKVDRYPTIELNAAKVCAESGELMDAVLKLHDARQRGEANLEPFLAAVRKEYGDVGLSLHALGTKLGLDLLETEREVVRNETREFR